MLTESLLKVMEHNGEQASVQILLAVSWETFSEWVYIYKN